MRGSGWALPIVATMAWAACVAWPVVALAMHVIGLPHSDVKVRSATALLMTSVGWAAAVAIGSMAIGWAPGRVLGQRLNRRGFAPLATLALAPICLPAYVVFYAWWQSWPAETAIYRWIVEHNQMAI